MPDQTIQPAVDAGVDLLKDLVFAMWKAATGESGATYTEGSPLDMATRRYLRNLIGQYNLVKVLGMREPVPLKNLYVRANILEKISARAGLRPEDLAESFDLDRRAFGKQAETVDGALIVNRLQKFIVLGKPGAGKTTYLKYLALMMLDPASPIERRLLPIFVTLREWADENLPLLDFILGQFNTCHFPETALFLEKMLAAGQCLVLFDGLDEVGRESNQDDIIGQIRSFTNQYPDNQFVVSCRVAAYNHWFEQFTDVEMTDFNEAQMETFINNWFHGEPKVAAECWSRLKNSPPLRELASVPLLLTLLCLEYGESNDFPANRAELYKRAIETLLTKWDSSRRIRRAEVYKHLSLLRKESMFARIAFSTFSQNEYFIPERRLAKLIEKYIEHLPGFDPAELEPDSRVILKAIEAQHGIFVERAKDVYSFAHLTFQEYFVAKYIVDHQWKTVDQDCNLDETGKVSLLEQVVEKYLDDPKWKEVFLLVAGMLDDADELLLLMRRKANVVLEVAEIDELFRAAKEALLPKGNKYPEVVRKNVGACVFLGFDITLRSHIGASQPALWILAMTQTIVLFDRFNYAFNLKGPLFNTFEHVLIVFSRIVNSGVNDHNTRVSRKNRTKTNYFNLLKFHLTNLGTEFDLDKNVFASVNRLSEYNLFKLSKYLTTNALILNCLHAGAYVSNPIREKMLHEMFLPKEDLGPGREPAGPH